MATKIDELFDYATDRGWRERTGRCPYDDILQLEKIADPDVTLEVVFSTPNRVAEASGRCRDTLARVRSVRILGGMTAIKKFIREA